MKETDDDKGLIFVYGTLRANTACLGSLSKHFDRFRTAVTPATVKGVIYDLGYFPALILGGPGLVYGELHKYSNFTEVIEKMDKIEGYFGFSDPNNLYRRIKAQVAMVNPGIFSIATVYEFAHSVDSYPKVHSGTWMIDGPKTQRGEQL